MKEVISKLIVERLELVDKTQRLHDFIVKYNQLFTHEYVELLNKQHSIMIDYVNVLNDRIALLKGEKT